MPKYITGGKTYNIPDEKISVFEADYPDATIEYHIEGETYDIPLKDKQDFIKQYPNATTSVPKSTIEQLREDTKKRKEAAEKPTGVDYSSFGVKKPFYNGDIEVSSEGIVKEEADRVVREQEAVERANKRIELMDAPDFIQSLHNTMSNTHDSLQNTINNMEGVSLPAEREHKAKMESINQAESVGAITPREADIQRRAEDISQKFALTPSDAMMRKQNATQVAELSKVLDERMGEKEADAKRQIKTFDDAVGAKATTQSYIYTPTHLLADDADYQTMKAAKRSLEDAQKLIDEADRTLNAEDYSKSSQRWHSGLARGAKDQLFDVRTWDMGITDAKDMTMLSNALDKEENGEELTDAEKALLEAKAYEMAVNAYFGSHLGKGYKAGVNVGAMAPFMLEMAINPLAAVGKTAQNKLVRYALKKYGKGLYQRKLKYNALKYGSRLIGDIAGAAGMTLTSSLPRTYADAMSRHIGNVKPEYADYTGRAGFGGTEGGVSAGRAAYEAIAAGTTERFTEMSSYFLTRPFRGMKLPKMDNKAVKAVSNFVQNANNTDLARIGGEIAKKTQWGGVVGEYFEEVENNILNAALVGDMKFDNSEEGVFNLQNNWLTLQSVAAVGGSIATLKTGYYPIYKYKQARNLKKADAKAADAFGDEWEGIKASLNGLDEQSFANLIALGKRLDVTPQQKEAAKEYLLANVNLHAAQDAAIKQLADAKTTPEEMEVSQAYDEGRALVTPEEMNEAKRELEDATNEIRNTYQLGEDKDVDEFLGDTPLEDVRDSLKEEGSEAEAELKLRYLTAKAKYDGMIDRVGDKVRDEVETSNRMVDSIVNNDMGGIINATIASAESEQGVPVNIVSGVIATDKDGNIDIDNTDSFLIYKDKDGSLKHISKDRLMSAQPLVDVNTYKKQLASEIVQHNENEATAQIDGILPMNVGDTFYVMDEKGLMHQAAITNALQDGSVEVSIDNAKPQQMTREAVQAMHDAFKDAEYQEKKAKREEQERVDMQQTEAQLQEEDEKKQVEEEAKQAELPQTATLRVPVGENGNLLYEQVDSDTAWDALVEQAKGNEATAQKIADMGVKKAQKALDEVKQSSINEDMSIEEMLEAENAHNDAVAAAEANLNKWKEIATTPQRRAEEAQRVAETEAKAEAMQERIDKANEAISEEQKKAEQRMRMSNARAALQNGGRYQSENAELGAPIDFADFVMRAIATGGVRFIWGNNQSTGTRGLGSHTGFGEQERRKRIGILSNAGLYPEVAAEQLLSSYADEIGYNPNIDTSDALSTILDVVMSYTTPKEMMEAAQARHAEVAEKEADIAEIDAEEAYYRMMAAEHNMTVLEYMDMEAAREENFIEKIKEREKDKDKIDAIFVELYLEEDYDNKRRNQSLRQGVSGQIRSGASNEGGSIVLPSAQSDNTRATQRSAEGQGTTAQISNEGSSDLSASQTLGEPKSIEDTSSPQMRADEGVQPAGKKLSRAMNMLRIPLRKRINAWSRKVGVPVVILENFSDVTSQKARTNILEAERKDRRVTGWVEDGKVYLYMPNLRDIDEIDETYTHEVVAHKGMDAMLGKEKYRQFCLDVFDQVMTEADREFYLKYEGVKEIEDEQEKKAKAADEYIAHLSESTKLTKREAKLWDKIVDLFRKMLESLGYPQNISKLNIEDMLRKSYNNLLEGNIGASTESEGTQFRVLKDEAKSLVGIHNISAEKLQKAINMGGLANPSVAVLNIDKQDHSDYGEISLILPKDMVDARLGRNAGTWAGDAWTPTYPQITKRISKDKDISRFYKDISAIPEAMRGKVRLDFDSFMDGRSANALAYWYLFEKGVAPELAMIPARYPEEIADAINEATNGSFSMFGLSAEDRAKCVDAFIAYKYNGDRAAYDAEMNARKERLESFAKSHERAIVRKKAQEDLDSINEYGLDYDEISRFIRDVEWDVRHKGEVDADATIKASMDYIAENNLAAEYDAWRDKLNERYGIKEYIFDGYTNSGTPRYLPHTIENASKWMKKQGRQGAVATFPSFGTFVAVSIPKMTTLDSIRKRKNLLGKSKEEYDAFREKWENVYYELGKKLQPDANGFDDYGYWRLIEAVGQKNPKEYIKKQYDIELSEEDVNTLNEMLEAIRNEYPARYFETKFERPINIREFVGAVVPENIPNDLEAELQEAGLNIYKYNPQKEGSRREATLDAVNSDDIRFRTAPAFYSNAERAVENIKQEKATPEQWLKMIEKNGGLKAGEDKWLGLSDWLKASDKKTLTKQEVLDYIKANEIQIEEVTYADIADVSKEDIYNSDEFLALVDSLTEFDEDENPYIDRERYDELRSESPDFVDGFSLDYWGETLDVNSPAAAATYLGLSKADKVINETRLGYTTDGLNNKREIALVVPTIESWNESDEIHFGDAGNGRAIAWVRFGETTDAEGNRVLVIDEVQSKRHQEGREKGYNNPRIIEMLNRLGAIESYAYSPQGMSGEMFSERESLKAELETLFEKENPVMKSIAEQIAEKKAKRAELIQEKSDRENDEKVEIFRLQDKQDKVRNVRDYDYYESEIENIKEKIEQRNDEIDSLQSDIINLNLEYSSYYNTEIRNARIGVSPAPFEKDWMELAMKRMLRYAAENGFDKVAWTTGEQQAERYDMSNYFNTIKRFDIDSMDGRRFELIGYDTIGINVNDDGQVISSSMPELEGKALSDIVGKEMAIKMMQMENGTSLEDADIKVGGEGMKAFYDQMIPSFMNKYGKKWGVKVGEVTMPNLEENNTMHSVDVTPAMRESVMQGQPMFRVIQNKSRFDELQKEYDALDKNDEAALNAWRDKKVGVVRDYLEGVAQRFGMKPKIVIFNGADEAQMKEAYDKVLESYKKNGGSNPPSFESFKNHALKPKVRATYRRGGEMITLNVSTQDEYNDTNSFAGVLFHENAHYLAYILFNDKKRGELWSDVVNTKHEIVKLIKDEYPDKSYESKGGELIAYSIQKLVEKHKASFFKFLDGENDMTAGTLVEKLNINEINANFAIIDVLNAIKDEYTVQVSRRDNASRMGGVGHGGDIRTSEGNSRSTSGRIDSRGRSQSTLLDSVAQKGLRGVVSEDALVSFFKGVYNHVDNATRNEIYEYVKRNGNDFWKGTEQYLASLAENNTPLDGGVRDAFVQMLNNNGIEAEGLTDNDIRYMMWRTNQLKDNKGALSVAEDVVMKQKLGVNNAQPNAGVSFRVTEAKPLVEQVKEVINEYDNSEDIFTIRDVADRISEIINEYDGDEDTTELENILADYEDAQDSARRYGYRWDSGGEDALEEALRRFANTSRESNISFRVVSNRKSIKDQYNKKVKTNVDSKSKLLRDMAMTSYNFQEAMQDEMLALKIFQQLLEDKFGVNIPSYLNVYNAENSLASRNKEEMDRFEKTFYEDMMKEIDRLAKKGASEQEIRDYVIAKSGIERSIEFGVRDYINEQAERKQLTDKEAKDQLAEIDEKVRNSEITPAEADAMRYSVIRQRNTNLYDKDIIKGMRELYEEKRNKLRDELYRGDITFDEWVDKSLKLAKQTTGKPVETDYAGLSTMAKRMGQEEKDWLKNAREVVNTFQGKYGEDGNTEMQSLWKTINACNKETLRKLYHTGLLSKELYDKLSNQFMFYVPMSGFSEDVAEDVYSYIGKDTGAFTAPLKKAEGRESESDDPFAIIGNKMQSAILQGNRNAMKIKFLNLVRQFPTDLITEGRIWEVKQPDGSWMIETPDIPADATADQVAKELEVFNERMARLKEKGDAKVHRGKADVPYKVISKEHKGEHEIVVHFMGEPVVLYVNGNARLAQAINGKLKNTQPNNVALRWLANNWAGFNRLMSANKTSWNPDFMIPNMVRDVEQAFTMTLMDSGIKDAAKLASLLPTSFAEVAKFTFDGNMDTERGKLFEEFLRNGGETGYSHINDLEEWKIRNRRRWDRLSKWEKAGAAVTKPFTAMGDAVSALNRIFEDTTRFAVYELNRKNGKSIADSIKAAKDISTNFNKKGSGATNGIWGALANFLRGWMLFFNPMVQGAYQHWDKMKTRPKAYALITAGNIGMGMGMAMLNDMWSGDDDEEKQYLNQNEYTRRSNLMIYTGKGYIKIPLAPVFREFYALGDIMYTAMKGGLTAGQATKAMFNTMRSVLSLEGQSSLTGKDDGKFSIVKAVAPQSLEFIADIIENEDFTGSPIYRDAIWDENKPEYQKVYNNTWGWAIKLSKLVNDSMATIEGDDFLPQYNNLVVPRHSSKAINPAVWQHAIEAVGGGIVSTLGNTIETVSDAFDPEEEVNKNAIPVARRFYTEPSERNRSRILQSNYYDITKEQERRKIKYDALKADTEVKATELLDENIDEENTFLDRVEDTKNDVLARAEVVADYHSKEKEAERKRREEEAEALSEEFNKFNESEEGQFYLKTEEIIKAVDKLRREIKKVEDDDIKEQKKAEMEAKQRELVELWKANEQK
jgi:hypothetical protein